MRIVVVELLIAVLLACHTGLAFALAPPASPVDLFVQIDPSSRQFIDASGRSLLFHGSSVVYKEPPFVPDMTTFDPLNSLCEQDAQVLQDLGFNFMRVYVAWQGVMPSPGIINTTYLDQVEALVALLASHNISSILDCHQDVLAPAFCGEGVPEFISDALYHNSSRKPQAFPLPVSPSHHSYPVDPATGHPNRTQCLQAPFWHYYFSDAVSKGFQSLYDNDGGVLNSFEQFWVAVASRFKDNPAVLGYELLNEPWVGDFYSNPKQLLARNADALNLAPMYKRLHNAIRTVDDNHIIFFEPTVLVSQLPLSYTDRSGFDEGPGGPIYNDRQAMSVHTYCFAQTADGQPKSKALCHYTDDSYMHVKAQDLQRINVAGFMTEWGALKSAAKGSPEYIEAQTVTGLADQYLLSWSYWMFKPYHDITTQAVDAEGNVLEGLYDSNGVLREDKAFVLTRTYARAVAGTLLSQSFDLDTAAFHVTYRTAAAAASGLQSEIYASTRYHYPRGFSVAFAPATCCTWAMQSSTIVAISHASSVEPGSQITVSITANS